MIGYLVGGMAVVGVAAIGIHEYTETAKEDGYRAGELACVTQAAKENAEVVERLKVQVAAAHDINRKSQVRLMEVHKALEQSRLLHKEAMENQCHPGCHILLPKLQD